MRLSPLACPATRGVLELRLCRLGRWLPWGRRYQVFQEGHGDPEDPEVQLLLALLGTLAHPWVQWLQLLRPLRVDRVDLGDPGSLKDQAALVLLSLQQGQLG